MVRYTYIYIYGLGKILYRAVKHLSRCDVHTFTAGVAIAGLLGHILISLKFVECMSLTGKNAAGNNDNDYLAILLQNLCLLHSPGLSSPSL